MGTYCASRETAEVRQGLGLCEGEGREDQGKEVCLHFGCSFGNDCVSCLVLI